MVKKSNIYTKNGDKGETSLVSGTKVYKSEERIDLYGDLDELNSLIGFSLSLKEINSIVRDALIGVQKNLFIMGSNIACEKEKRVKFNLPELESESIKGLESVIDRLDERLPRLSNFILPGGSELGSRLHLCRTLTRKIERKMTGFDLSIEKVPPGYLSYLNRLSDFLFVCSRFVNQEESVQETTWP